MIAGMAADSIGTRIKKRRQALGMRSQQELAGRIGVNRTTVSDWESDRYFPGRFQGALEEVLGIRLDDDGRFRPVSDDLRRQIAEVLKGDAEAQRRVIGLLEGTMSWPEGDDAPAQERSAR